MKRWLKRTAWAIGALLLVALAFVLEERIRGRLALRARVGQLTAAGERLSWKEVEPKRPPPDKNAFIDLVGLSNRLAAAMTALGSLPPSARFAAPGRAIITWHLDEWAGDGESTNTWPHLAAALAGHRDLLEAIRSAIEKPAYDSGFDYRKGLVDFELAPLTPPRRCAQILAAAAANELGEGNLEAAHRHLLALVRLTAEQKPEPLVICQLVRIASGAIAFNTTWLALQSPGWTDPQLASVQAAWEECDFAADMAGALEMERALQLDFYEQLRNSGPSLEQILGRYEQMDELAAAFTGSLPTRGFALHRLHAPFWRFAWADQDALRSLDDTQASIERYRFGRAQSWAALSGHSVTVSQAKIPPPLPERTDPEHQGWYDRLRFLFSNTPSALGDSLALRALSIQTQRQMAVAAVAIHRYAQRTGRPPGALNVLVPDYLHEVPRDPMDGQPLRYRPTEGGKFVLYSVGEDGKDDGGDPSASPGKERYRRITDGRDFVWPIAATAAEEATPEK